MSSKSSNSLVNPNARDAMNRFKMEAASQVKKMTAVRIMSFVRRSRTSVGHEVGVTYVAGMGV